MNTYAPQTSLRDIDYINIFGRSAGALLKQVYYWITKNKGGVIHNSQRWVYNTYEDWGKQLGYSERTIRLAVKKLKDIGVLLCEKLTPWKANKNYYTIDLNTFNKIIHEKKGDEVKPLAFSPMPQEISDNQSAPFVALKNSEIDREAKPKEEKPLKILKADTNQVALVGEEYDPALDMLNYWNETFLKSQWSPSDKLKTALRNAFNTKFDRNIKVWKNYCARLESSDWIMNRTPKKFSLNLFSVLSEHFIDSIMAGQYGAKNIPLILETPEEKESKVKEHLFTSNESDEIKYIRQKILSYVGVSAYQSWFENRPLAIQDSIITITAINGFAAEHTYISFRSNLERILEETEYDRIVFASEEKNINARTIEIWKDTRPQDAKKSADPQNQEWLKTEEIDTPTGKNCRITTKTTQKNTNITQEKNVLESSGQESHFTPPSKDTLKTIKSDQIKKIRHHFSNYLGKERYDECCKAPFLFAQSDIFRITVDCEKQPSPQLRWGVITLDGAILRSNKKARKQNSFSSANHCLQTDVWF